MKKCKYCQSEIDEKATICPNCRKTQNISIARIIGGVIIGLFIFMFLGLYYYPEISFYNKKNYNDFNSNYYQDFSYEVTNSYSEYDNYFIEGIVTNNTSKNYSYVQIEFVCYDSEGNNLGTAFDNTNNLNAGEKWKFEAISLFTNDDIDHCTYNSTTGY